MTTLQLKPWVVEQMLPYRPCPSSLIAASHYPDAQAAWDAWELPDEMMCALVRTNQYPVLSPCALDLIRPSLNILSERTKVGRTFRRAVYLIRRWKSLIYHDLVPELFALSRDIGGPLNVRYAAHSVFKAVKCLHSPKQACRVAFYVQNAIRASFEPTIDGKPFRYPLIDEYENADLDDRTIRLWLCDCIRRHHPAAPVHRPLPEEIIVPLIGRPRPFDA